MTLQLTGRGEGVPCMGCCGGGGRHVSEEERVGGFLGVVTHRLVLSYILRLSYIVS